MPAVPSGSNVCGLVSTRSTCASLVRSRLIVGGGFSGAATSGMFGRMAATGTSRGVASRSSIRRRSVGSCRSGSGGCRAVFCPGRGRVLPPSVYTWPASCRGMAGRQRASYWGRRRHGSPRALFRWPLSGWRRWVRRGRARSWPCLRSGDCRSRRLPGGRGLAVRPCRKAVRGQEARQAGWWTALGAAFGLSYDESVSLCDPSHVNHGGAAMWKARV
jgi:hypothetical protein